MTVNRNDVFEHSNEPRSTVSSKNTLTGTATINVWATQFHVVRDK